MLSSLTHLSATVGCLGWSALTGIPRIAGQHLIPALRKQRQADLCEVKASLVYTVPEAVLVTV